MSEASTSAAPGLPKACPKCGAAIPPEAPQGLCPKCLLQQASFPTETGATTRHSRPAPPDRDELARAFPHLQILELIGQGGMGFVYKARQPKLDRLVALKILAQPLAEQTHFAERFTREGRTLAKLNHPNIVTIHDFGQAGPFFYLLMEYVDGVNLRQAMRAGAINSSQALAIVPRICEALQYAHNEGVLHRDIKPDNILLDTRGRVKIADFGIAKLMAEAVAENPLTGSGASLGTPHYMAPEQIEKPNAVDHRADIYSLGVVFYEMLTGELPLGRFAAPSEKSAVDPRLDDVVFQTLEKQPERRPQSADEVRTRVETISSGPQKPGTPDDQVAFKMAKCYLTTPEFLRSSIGRLLRFTKKGEIRLDEETLTFAPRRQNWIVIPLRAITSLSLGDFPAGIGKLKFISVTFTEKGYVHRCFFTPTRGAFRSIWNTNKLVEEWFDAIRAAAKARTGRIPPSFKDDVDPLPAASPSRDGFAAGGLKAALVLASLVILGIGIGVGAFIGLYALLRHSNLRPSDASATLTAKPQPFFSNANTRAINVTSVDAYTLKQSISLRTTSDAAAGEDIVPVVRYNSGPWSQSDSTSKNLEWITDKSGLHHRGMYQWRLPSGFNSEFDMLSAAARARAAAEGGPLTISSEPTEIFSITNQSGQVVSGGLRLLVSSLPQQPARPVATLKDVVAYPDSNRGGAPTAECQADIPAGYRLIARGRVGEEKFYARSYTSSGRQMFEWSVPPSVSLTLGKPSPFMRVGVVEIAAGETNELFSLPAGQDYFRAFLELVPMEGMALPVTTGTSASPVKVAASSVGDSSRAETLEVSLRRRSVEPRRVFMEARGFLTLDRSIVAVVTYPMIENSGNARQRMPRPMPSASPQFGGLVNDPTSVWRKERGATNYEGGDLIWDFKETFSLERDLTPAVDRFFAKQNEMSVRLAADKPTPLFRMTNAFGEIAECAIEFVKTEPAVKDASAGVIVTSLSGFTNEAVIVANFAVAFPKDFDVQASGACEGKRTRTILTRNMTHSGSVECRWLFPEGFLPVQREVTNQTQARTTTPGTPIPMPAGGYYSLPAVFERLSQRARAGDARVTAAEPLEVFAITNAENRVFRGFLEIATQKSTATQLQDSNERPGASPAPSGSRRRSSSESKVFEFNSVTNSGENVPNLNAASAASKTVEAVDVAESANPRSTPVETALGETRRLPLHFRGFLPPNLLEFEASADLALNESIRTMVRYNDGKWDDNDFASTYRVSGGPERSRRISFFWTLPENFSFPFDVKPVLDGVFGDDKTKLVRLSTNGVSELFSVTNALKQRITCGLRYVLGPASNSDTAAITNAISNPDPGSVTVQFYGLVPAGTRLEPYGTYGTNAYFGVSLERRDFRNAEAKFSLPPNLPRLNSEYRRPLSIRRGESAEIFSLTNSDNQVFRAFFKLEDVQRTPVGSSKSAKVKIPAVAPKTFEFNSVTNSGDYIVLQSETPIEVGKELIALVEDSTGKTNRAISGLTVRHTPSETHTTAQLMWKMPDGSPTNWMADTMQKLRETILAKPIQLSEGESRRLFDLRTVPGSVQQFAGVRYETVAPSKTPAFGTVRVRSAAPMSNGLILHFDADVPRGYRLEAEAGPSDGGSDVRLDHSNIAGNDYYHAIWLFQSMSAQDSADLRYSLTNSTTRLTRETFAIDVGKPNPIYTFKTTSGREFHAILKLNGPNEHRE